MSSSSSSSSSSSFCSTPELYQEYPHARSRSLPSLPNPHYLRLEQQLIKLNSSPSSTMDRPQALGCIRSRLCGLTNLYVSLEELMSCPLTRQSLLHHEHGRFVEQALDASVIFLGTMSTLRDLASRMRHHLGDLQSALRRRGGPTEGRESYVNAYLRFRKSSNKEIVDAARMLAQRMKKKKKKYDTMTVGFDVDCEDSHLGMMAKVLREVAATTTAILQSLLISFSTPLEGTSKAKRQLQTFMSKMGLFHESSRSEISINEIGSVDSALWSYLNISSDDEEKVQAQMRTLEVGIQSIEGSFDGVFRCLVQYRVSFLNMLSN